MGDWSEPMDDAKWMSPDCRGGANHQKCDLQAWDDIDDVPTDCGCDCHVEVSQ